MTGLKKMFWVFFIVLCCSLVLVSSVATAKSEYQEDNPGTNLPSNRNTLEDEMTIIRAPLSLEASNYFIIPPSGFVSDGNNPDQHFISFFGGAISGKTDYGECMAAAVHLPLGTMIEGFEVRINDNNASYHEWFELYRINLETGSAESIGLVASPEGTTDGIVSLIDETITTPIVSDIYAYQLTTCLLSNVYVYGIRIGYSYVSYLPTVQD